MGRDQETWAPPNAETAGDCAWVGGSFFVVDCDTVCTMPNGHGGGGLRLRWATT